MSRIHTVLLAAVASAALAVPAAASAAPPAAGPATPKIALLEALQNQSGQLDQQLAGVKAATQQRNARIADLSKKLAELQTTKNAPSASDQIQALKGQIDAMASGSQTDMIRLQSLIAKRNDAIEMVSNLLQKFQTTQDQIIANMR